MRNALAGSMLALSLSLALPAPHAHAQPPALTPHEQDLVDAYEVMQGVTLGLIGLTAAGGALQLYNLPTTFGEGACAEDRALFGDYACSGRLSLVHAIAGILTLASYTATAALAFAAPDLDAVRGEDGVTDGLGVAHGIGIALTPMIGLIAGNPGLIGLHGQAAEELSRHLRVVHFVVGLVTAGLFATHLAVDQIN